MEDTLEDIAAYSFWNDIWLEVFGYLYLIRGISISPMHWYWYFSNVNYIQYVIVTY